VLVTASIASDFATGVGLLAGSIAVFGFVAQAYPALTRASESAVRRLVVIGGLVGLAAGGFVIVLSAII
jgi:hypothetical protein